MVLRHPSRSNRSTTLQGRRIRLRPLEPSDFRAWSEVRQTNHRWLTIWEPLRTPSQPDPTRDRAAFASRCMQRERDRAAGTAYQFGVFLGEDVIGEVNLNNVIRGALQSGTIGYWIDQRRAGNSYIAEAVVVVMRHAFEQLGLHRLEICIVPRNAKSRRVMEKLHVREEGVAVRYLEINGTWEDHVRYGFTAEEWADRGNQLMRDWIAPGGVSGQ
jgi:ribosomal-protein-alanine N-acetyltransferase